MARNLQQVQNEQKAERGTENRFLASDLEEVAVFADTYRDVLRRRSTESAKFYMGHGRRNTDDPNAGYMYADLQNSTPGAIDGRFRFIVYADSEREVPIVGPTTPANEMREAVSEPRRERPALPLQLPGAGKDKEIAVQFQAEPSSDGDTISAADSDVSIPYTQILE